MSKRRMCKPSELDVVCFYCSESMQFKALEKHTIRRHSGQPAREKGPVSLFEFQQLTQKKRRTDEKTSKESGLFSNEQPSIISSIASRVINAVNALGKLITSLRGIVTCCRNLRIVWRNISQKDSLWRQRRRGKIYKILFKEGPHQSEILHYVIGVIAYLFITQNPTRKKNYSMFLPSSAASNFFQRLLYCLRPRQALFL